MKGLCRSRTELSRKDLMGEQTHYWGQASTKSPHGPALPLLFQLAQPAAKHGVAPALIHGSAWNLEGSGVYIRDLASEPSLLQPPPSMHSLSLTSLHPQWANPRTCAVRSTKGEGSSGK